MVTGNWSSRSKVISPEVILPKTKVMSPKILRVNVIYLVLYAIMRQNKRDNCVIKSRSLSNDDMVRRKQSG